MVLRGQHRDRRAGLGQAVRVDEARRGKQPQRSFQHRRRHPRPAVGDRAQRGDLRRRLPQLVDDAGQHRRHHHRAGDPLARDDVQPRGGVEIRQVHHPAARVQVRQRAADRGDMVGRHAGENTVVRSGATELDSAQNVATKVLVAEEHALGLRGSTAGKKYDDDFDASTTSSRIVEASAAETTGHPFFPSLSFREPGSGAPKSENE